MLSPLVAMADSFDCTGLHLSPALETTYATAPTADFDWRDRLQETDVSKSDWGSSFYGTFGPCPITYPKVISTSLLASVLWAQMRVVAIAKKYIGLPYKHRHIPALGGLDCSNFTSWVYNYGFGIRFSSNVKRQSTEAGRQLDPSEPLLPGDLVFLYDHNQAKIVHVAIYLDRAHVIDSAEVGVDIRPYNGRYKTDLAWARRVIE